ncbi:TLC domain-containing protein At5g14285-like [Lotus japonicus]|uniref:TLC domain-containing protein At5g14285-like n=1 Tax=Lotus japonicus TaxID=34305 RepID=UPI002590F74F|nr:TLC domain-containing protein At5g14285-like [Lotus japonicus]
MPTLEFGFLLFFFMFLTIYLFGYFIIFPKRTPEFRFESCSCLISLFHVAPAVITGAIAFFFAGDRAFAFLSDPNLMATNTALQNTVLDFSMAFLVADLLLHYAATFSGAATDKLLYKRHVSTLFLIVTCRHLVLHWAFAVPVLLFLAEVANMSQNLLILAGVRRRKDFFSAWVNRSFTTVRSSMCWVTLWAMAIYASIAGIYASWKQLRVEGEKGKPENLKKQQEMKS